MTVRLLIVFLFVTTLFGCAGAAKFTQTAGGDISAQGMALMPISVNDKCQPFYSVTPVAGAAGGLSMSDVIAIFKEMFSMQLKQAKMELRQEMKMTPQVDQGK